EEVYYVSGGMLEVQPKVVTVLADTAIRADDVNEAAAEQAMEDARKALANQQGDIDYSTATAQLAEAAAQLRTIQQLKKKLGK
ncbi:MAG: F0F1 ATP synthase subunit epsilon, partial [Pseudomonadales bacterium]|nr:F0F1 ATP synthase subunit epsilon [Pseudomonadales bacterium]